MKKRWIFQTDSLKLSHVTQEKETLPKAYVSELLEQKWSKFWEDQGFFCSSPLSGKTPYSMIMPPPNVTGVLHMGHALVSSLQDILIRWKRMQGYEVLWVPGLDHAGISTQTVVEKDLMAKSGKRRIDFERKVFVERIWEWKERAETRIVDQLKKMGCSCDWTRKRFTMDAKANVAVRTLFKKLFDEGLIYRGDYLVNWDPVTETALADDEVEYEERNTSLWFFRYPLEHGKATLTVATTRPETLLGDVALAVSPQDPRYQKFVGKRAILPIVGRKLPILADPFVDPSFGTGVVKITPAHDLNDWEMGKRHHLPLINLLNPNGTLNENGGTWEGLSMEEARSRVVEEMEALGYLEKVQPHRHRVGLSYRSKAIIQPYLSKQWFLKMGPFKAKLIDAVKSGAVTMVPKQWESLYFHWIENLRDWCLSRQLWWGHRIPIWYHTSGKVLCYAGEGEPPEIQKNRNEWSQDPDVLDTWFSSALWPFSSLGWPDATDEMQKFYPNSILVTGHDILFFWVARMIAMGEYALGKVPFPTVSLQGLIFGKSHWKETKEGITYVSHEKEGEEGIRSKWEKMSKSKGNVIDPIEIITAYGADAMRLALAASATQSSQIDLDRRRFLEFKNFINKIWNASRFVLMHLTLSTEDLMEGLGPLAFEDRWILSVLNKTVRAIEKHLEGYHFDRFAMDSYAFFWNHFCAYYVELAKPILFAQKGCSKNTQRVLTLVLLTIVRLIHPIAPFITEEIFQRLQNQFPGLKTSHTDPHTNQGIQALLSPACAIAPYPKAILEAISPEVEATFTALDGIVHAIRNIRAEMQLPPSIRTDVIIEGETEWVEKHATFLTSLVRIQTLAFNPENISTTLSASALVQNLKITLPLPESFQEKEKKRLMKERAKLEERIVSLKKRLSDSSFVTRAPKDLVEQTEKQLQECEKQLLTQKHLF